MHGWTSGFQVALNSHQKATQIKEDGPFGPITANAVGQEQGRHHFTKDGVAGRADQNAIATAEAKTAEVTRTRSLVGLFGGVAEGDPVSSSPRSVARTGTRATTLASRRTTSSSASWATSTAGATHSTCASASADLAAKLRKQYDPTTVLAWRGHGARRLVRAILLPQLAPPLPRRPRTASSTRGATAVARIGIGPLRRRRARLLVIQVEPAVACVPSASGATATSAPRSCTKSQTCCRTCSSRQPPRAMD